MSGGDSKLYASASRSSRCFFNERTFRFKTIIELKDIEVLFLGVVNGRRDGKILLPDGQKLFINSEESIFRFLAASSKSSTLYIFLFSFRR